MKPERAQPQPPPDRATALVTAIEALRQEVAHLRQVIDGTQHPAAISDWVPGREPLTPAPPPPSMEPAVDAAPAGPAPEQATAPEKQRTITVVGQVERTPVLTRTPRGKPLAIFPLTVTSEGAPAESHSVLAFDARAAKARQGVRRGDQVEVIGYPHPREAPQPDGTTKVIVELYAVRVIRASDRKVLV